ncbi:MAG: hypothetical protein KDB79_05095, partial [Acidobacteria bacterium]|nr:hypothetical protein [Acidobacteriota bacterium]
MLPTLWEKIEFNALEECEGKPKGCAASFLEQLQIDTGKRPWFNVYPIGERNGKNLTMIFVSHSVNDDASVTGIRYRLALSLGDVEDRSYKLETLGRQYRCARGRKGRSKALCT